MLRQATGDRKSPACWQFARTEDDAERYTAFEAEINSRPFGFMGPRTRIVKQLETLAPPSLELAKYKAKLVEKGLEGPGLSTDFKHKFIDVVAFLCCLSRQASDVTWSDRQLKRWEELGLNVAEELAKSKTGGARMRDTRMFLACS